MQTRPLAEIMIQKLRERFPWLVAEWNGAEWESERTIVRRRLRAVEGHLRDLEARYAQLENRLLEHSNGYVSKHRTPKPQLPPPDQEG